jgi:hypothetical protein
MAVVKGSGEFKKFKNGDSLTRKQAMSAMCFDCMGGVREDCLGTDCPLYDFRPHKEK